MSEINLEELFYKYFQRKKRNILYTDYDYIPIGLLILYVQSSEKSNFDNVYDSFKKKYITNENYIENVHTKAERDGLKEVYDFIDKNKWIGFNSIYLLLLIHIKLYSKVPHPEFGGKFRKCNACISDSDVTTSDKDDIAVQIKDLDKDFQELHRLSLQYEKNHIEFDIFNYIDKAIELKVKLIKIHPFADGNGRSCRALLNILFKKIYLPPVYIEKNEKEIYIKNMDEAIRLNQDKNIKRFYYYKLCDAIYELDMKNKIKKNDIASKIKTRKKEN